MKKFEQITPRQISTLGVQALADRPNAATRYGEGGLSASQLKVWFDQLSKLLADRYNDIASAFSSSDVGEYLALPSDWKNNEIESFKALLDSIQNGKLATLLGVTSVGDRTMSLQGALYGIASLLSEYDERISENYIKGEKGDTGVLVMSVEGKTLVLDSENNLLTVEDGVLIIS